MPNTFHQLLASIALASTLLPMTHAQQNQPPFEAGAFVQDVTGSFDSYLVSGGFTERRRGKMNPGDLNARCFVLKKGDTRIAIAIVDSCMIPRTVCDQAKAIASKSTGIPANRILVCATHTHSAPSVMDYCLGTMADPAYTKFLPGQIAEGIQGANKKLEPARIGWTQVRAPGYTNCRRWITRPDRMQHDPFGQKTVRAMMHPGYLNQNYIGPSGPVDDQLSLVSIQTAAGHPLGVIANYSMHYFGGGPSDYFGIFADQLSKLLAKDGDGPVCAMSQGTSGDLHWMDYGKAKKSVGIQQYAGGLASIAAKALADITYSSNPPLAMDEQVLTLGRRLPNKEKLAWADQLLSKMEGRRPKSRPEVYAEQARFIHENPTEKLVLQTLRIGDLGITTLPNEVYSITALKLKARSPFPATFNIELANGAAGYIPPPAQHALGGYTTWPARTAGLEVGAEPRIVDTLLGSLESLSGKARKADEVAIGKYARAILDMAPLAYWRCGEFEGNRLEDASGNGRAGTIDGTVAYYLPGPENESFTGESRNTALQLAGGSVSATLPGVRSLSFWLWNGMPSTVRDNTGDIVSCGETFQLRIGGKADGESKGRLLLETGQKTYPGTTTLGLKRWHQVLVSIDGDEFQLFLDGNVKPEIQANLPVGRPDHWKFGDNLPFEGRLDEIAWFAKPLSGKDARKLHTLSGIQDPPPPPPPPAKMERGSTQAYGKAVLASKPVAYWKLNESATDHSPNGNPGTLEKGVRPQATGDTFTRGRLKAMVEGIGDTYSISFWFRNSLPNHSRPVTAYLFSRGKDGLKSADGDQLGIGGTYASAGRLIVYHGNTTQKLLTGKTEILPGSWHQVTMVREGEHIRVYLNGNPKPEIEGKLPRSYPEGHPEFFLGGRNDNFSNLQGSLDEAALYGRAIRPEEVAALFKTVKLSPSMQKKKETGKPPLPLPPGKALASIHLPQGFTAQLVAAEPLVKDPVAIDWAPDGKLWVAEMADYPHGVNGKPGGRVRYLEDKDGDGVYDRSSVFLEGLNFPAGVMCWKGGVLVAAAPDILYARDSTGDGKADIKEVLYTGFKQGNQQLRVNGLRWGLDNWIHGANGSHHSRYAAGIRIKSTQTGQEHPIGGMDFRIEPDKGSIESLSGPSQFGRERDDWGNWFGLQNSFPVWHYVLEHRYLSRNAAIAPPDPRKILLPRNPLVYPAKPPQKRYHNFNQSGRFTSACSPMVYRDNQLFGDGKIHAFICEPFHNLVQHILMERNGSSFTAKRAEADKALDFFASEDRWCRPVMARTGPDGALWVVDMYRYMIEHPEWLPAGGKAEMKPHERLGEVHGRIYRISKEGKPPRKFPMLDKVSSGELVNNLADNNGIIRDMAHRLLVERQDATATQALAEMTQRHPSAKARLHALCALDGLGRLEPARLQHAFQDPHPAVRRHALRLAETRWDAEPGLLEASFPLARDPDASVRLQAACSWGESNSPEAGEALAAVAIRDAGDPYIRAAAFSSAAPHFDQLAQAALRSGVLLDEVLRLGSGKNASLDALLANLLKPGPSGYQPSQFSTLAGWLGRDNPATPEMSRVITRAREIASDHQSSPTLRASAIGLLGRETEKLAGDHRLVAGLLGQQVSSEVKLAAMQALERFAPEQLPETLLRWWPSYLPRERNRALDTLFKRQAWIQACLDAIQQEKIHRGDLDAARRQLLLKHPDPSIRKQAKQALGTSSPNSRTKNLEAYRKALGSPADEKRGRAVFNQLCAVCHLPPKGLPMNGPDLRSITDRSKEGLFSSILDPNQTVDASYSGYSITLKDGATLYGRVLSESPNHLTLRLLDGTDRQLQRTSIKELKNTGLSLMPEGLETGMTPQGLADLILFLQNFKRDTH